LKLPLHLLIQNLLYDVSQISIPWDHVDEEYLERPQKWNPKSIARFTLYVGPVSSIFDFTTFALLWYVYGANTGAEQSFFQSGWFVLGLLSQTMIVHMIRTRKIPFIESTAARPVLIMTGLVMLAGLVIPFTPFGQALGFTALPLSFFGWLILTLLVYFIVMQAVKTLYIRRFKMWL
jgi:P-type Mg2+ transporter